MTGHFGEDTGSSDRKSAVNKEHVRHDSREGTFDEPTSHDAVILRMKPPAAIALLHTASTVPILQAAMRRTVSISPPISPSQQGRAEDNCSVPSSPPWHASWRGCTHARHPAQPRRAMPSRRLHRPIAMWSPLGGRVLLGRPRALTADLRAEIAELLSPRGDRRV
jgi:hypothetical protein